MVSRVRYLAGGLLIATATAISVPGDAYAQSPDAGKDCYVPHFSGAGSGAGAVAFMQVVNNGKGCSVRLMANGHPALGVTIVEQPAHGSVEVKANQFSYIPVPGYTPTLRKPEKPPCESVLPRF
jgi:hypothetical protein